MKNTDQKPKLSARVKIIRDVVGNGKSKRALRRAILIDRHTGMIHELPTVYVLRALGKKSLNTQLGALYNIAFYLEWADLKTARSSTWIRPEIRIRTGHLALTQSEIDDLANWCQRSAHELHISRNREVAGVRMLTSPNIGVESTTTNSRLRNICNYLCWLTRDMVEGTLMLNDEMIAKSSKFQNSLQRAFLRSLSRTKSTPSIISLSSSDSTNLRKLVTSPPKSHCRHTIRDMLIGRVLIETGLRAGEMLKIQCEDLQSNFEVQSGRYIAVLTIIKRPNDINDDRQLEPSVKTLPGPIVISRSLADQIIEYIKGDRRQALNFRFQTGRETPYLFLSHSGERIGLPLTYRNLHRIVAKLGLASQVSPHLTPHVLRHTHFTDLRQHMADKGTDPVLARRIMQERGHWSPNSNMPDHYSQRYIAEQQAAFIELRDKILEQGIK